MLGAEWKLKESIVYAPANGFIPDVQLKEGYIAGLNQPVLSLVSTDDWWIYGLFEQSRLGLVEPGDKVELIFRFYPGRVFSGKVEHIIRAVGQDQLPVNGMVTPVTPSQSDLQLFSVVDGPAAALIAAVVIGLVNATLGLFLKVVTFPLAILTLGIFWLIINAVMLKLASAFVHGFHIRGLPRRSWARLCSAW